MGRCLLWATIWGVLVIASGGRLATAAASDELEDHLASQRRQLEDASRSLAQRARVAMEMAGTLDRAAQSSPTVENRRSRWAEATALLDAFNAKEPRHPQKEEFAFQASVYLWARSQSWAQQYELAPTDRKARDQAIQLLDETIVRLRAIAPASGAVGGPLEQNRRFRLAQATADRASYESEGSPSRLQGEQQAIELLELPFTEPSLQGFAALLRAGLLAKSKDFEKAQSELKRASHLKPPPDAAAQLETRVAIDVGRKKYDEAIDAIDKAGVDRGLADLLAVRTRLAQREELPVGSQRTAAEADAFRRADALRRAGKPEARLALLALARTLELPDDSLGPEAWDLLAEGCLALDNPERASSLETQAADKAAAQGRKDVAASFRNRAGAMWYQAKQFAKADRLLTAVFADPAAGNSRPKAGLLRILARAQGLATGQPGCTRETLIDALQAQIREFPNDTTANEARWMLGKLRLGAGDRDEATALWSSIPHGEPRWLAARTAIAQLLQDALETQLLNEDRNEALKPEEEAQTFLKKSLASGVNASEKAELELCLARLAVTPGAAQPKVAQEICEGLLKSAVLVDQRDRARRLRIVALTQLGQFGEAERAMRIEVDRTPASQLVALARLLDHSAVASDSDLFRRRFGQLIRTALTRALQDPGELSANDRMEARLRLTRALLFSGSFDEARRSLERWTGFAEPFPDELLDDLADMYVRLEAYGMAVDVFRLRVQRTRPGTLPWFGARYALALAYYRSGKNDEARRLIDATSILHPDLGGGGLRHKFEQLRQRLAQE